MIGSSPVVSVSEFAALLNQTLEFAYPNITIRGELANFKVRRGAWVYFDLKDEAASVQFFGSVRSLPGPLKDGMMLEVRGAPRLHSRFGFSVNILTIQVSGEGSIKKAADLLKSKLESEGLFDPERKRPLPYPPARIGLITAEHSAAYRDFAKILDARWGGTEIFLADVAVQGETAPVQIIDAISEFNQMPAPPDVLVITRGGGSADDLQAFSQEQVTRAVSASRIPTLVAVGHEIDVSLAELAADQRASTPSNAAERLVPDRRDKLDSLKVQKQQLARLTDNILGNSLAELVQKRKSIFDAADRAVSDASTNVKSKLRLLEAFNPQAALQRGYALVRKDSKVVRSGSGISAGDELDVQLADATLAAEVKRVTME